jgi:ABC-type glycerol-3-phosphate transport system substrate-binding protein
MLHRQLLLVLGVFFIFLTGCGNGEKDPYAVTRDTVPEPLTVTLFTRRTATLLESNIESINRVVERIKEMTNVTLEYSVGPWNTNEFISALEKRVNAGDIPDLIFPPSRNAVSIMAEEDMIVPVGYIKQIFPQFYFSFKETYWEDGTVNGVSYGIPFRRFVGPEVWVVDSEKRRAVSEFPITTFTALERKAKEYSRIAGRKNLIREDSASPPSLLRDLLYIEKGWRPLPFMNNSMVLFLKENDPEIYSLFDEMNDEIRSIFLKAIRLYEEGYYFGKPPRNGPLYGYMNFDAKTADEWFAFKVSANSFLMDPFYTQGAVSNLSDYEFIYDTNGGTPPYTINGVNHFYLGNTKQTDRVVDFLTTLQNREYFDLIQYGITGVDWELKEDGAMEFLPESRYPSGAYWRNPLLMFSTDFSLWRDNARWPGSLNTIISRFLDEYWNGPEDILDLAEFNLSPVEKEIELYRDELYENMYLKLFASSEDFRYRWDQFEESAEKVVGIIRTVLQEQLDNYTAAGDE